MSSYGNTPTARDSQTLTLSDGRTLGYAEFGAPSGYPIIYFHGYPSSRLEGYGADALARRRNLRILALDRPGFGLSSPQPGRRIADWPADVRDFAQQTGLGRFAVLGGSGGGPYAVACAAALPRHMVSAVGVMAGAPPWEPGMHHYMSLSRRAVGFAVNWIPWVMRIMIDGLVGLVRMLVRTNYVKRQLDQLVVQLAARLKDKGLDAVNNNATVEERRERMLRVLLEAFAQGSVPTVEEGRLLSGDWGIRLQDIDFEPLLFWHGVGDKNAPIEMVRRLVKQIPSAELHELQDKNHYAIGDHLDEILGTLVPESAK